jgi:hypothetical protein
MKLATYERELIGLVQAVRHWRPYLWGRHFTVRTDHYALKFLLDQRLSMVPQHQWVSKLFGFDFSVEYRPGRLNTVADALSRRSDEVATRDAPDAMLGALSGPSFQLYDILRCELHDDPELWAFRDTVVADRGEPWHVVDGLVLWGTQVFVPVASQLVSSVIKLAHSVGHEGIQKTLQCLRQHFLVDHDRHLVEDFVRACVVCQRNKTDSLHLAGLLQPLEVPSSVWSNIAMDFVEGLP